MPFWRTASSSATSFSSLEESADRAGATSDIAAAISTTPIAEALFGGTLIPVRDDQRMAGHRRRFRQAEQIEQGRRDIGEPAIRHLGDGTGRVDGDERH